MITTVGKGLIARMLAGQIPSAFSYMAFGVGAKPDVPVTVVDKTAAAWSGATVLGDGVWGLESDTGLVKLGDGATAWSSLPYESSGILYEDEAIKNKTNLIFEAFRVPITAATVLFDGGQTKISLSASVPSAQRFEFSEIGVFSSETNSLVTSEKPKMIFTFSESEGWEHHSGATINPVLYAGEISSNSFDIDTFDGVDPKAFFVSADNQVFFTENRKNQRMRIYQDALLLRGNLSTVNDASSSWTLSGDHVHITGKPVNLTKARSDDELKVGLAVMNSTYNTITTAEVPAEVRVAIRFLSTENASDYATVQLKLTNGVDNLKQVPAETEFENNGYFVLSTSKKDIKYTANFSWEQASVAQVFVEVEPGSGLTAADYYVAVDAVRFDSNNNNNPAYGMTAYSAIRNVSASTELKYSDTESQIEYKVLLEV